MGARPAVCLEARPIIASAFSEQPLGGCRGFTHKCKRGGERRASGLGTGCQTGYRVRSVLANSLGGKQAGKQTIVGNQRE